MPPIAIVETYQDLIDHLSDYSGGGISDRGIRDYRRAAQVAYRDLALGNEWKSYLTRGRLNLNAAVDDGTIAIDVTGGSYERQVTITGSTWPMWAAYGTLLVDGVQYKVDERKSNTVLTLTYDSCPTVDVVAGTDYTLFQNVYPLPEDFRRLQGQGHFENDLGCMTALADVSQWLELQQHDLSGARPCLYAIGGSPDTWQYGKMSIYLHPYPVDAESVDFVYWRNPRALYFTGQETESRVGTVTGSVGGTTITGASTTFNSKMVGSIIRFSRNTTTFPDGLGGSNPYQEQRVITAVASATSLTIDSALDFAYAGNKYVITDPIDADGALLVALYRNAEMQLDNFRQPERLPGRIAMYQKAYVEAMERDQRCEPTAGLYGVMWQSGGTLIVSNKDDDDDGDTGGGTTTVPALLYSMAAIKTVASTSSESFLYDDTGAEGSRTIAANSWLAADVIRVKASGTYGTKATLAGSLTLRLSIGSSVLHLVGLTNMPDNQTAKAWEIDTTLTRHSVGAGGTISGVGTVKFAVTGDLYFQGDADPVVNETLDSTTNQTVTLTAEWGTPDVLNTITCSSLTIEQQSAA